jgi:Tfp pilus assembly PilM family ATPase
MFGIFKHSKRVVGVDIKSDCIRFLELETSSDSDRIVAYGEVTFDGVEPDEAVLIQYFRDIKKMVRGSSINVAVPAGSDEKKCFEIMASAGLKPAKVISPAKPLEFALVPENADTSFLIVDADISETNYLIFAPNIDSQFYTSDPANHSIISNLNRLYIDWYDRHKERIHHVLLCGARAADQDVLDYISRETKIPITQANIFINLKLSLANVPMIPKNESYKYATAMGLAMS